MGIIEKIALLAIGAMQAFGYPGLALMMALESMVFPLPSEVVMPFAGFLVAKGDFSWFGAIAASSIGTMIGSIISYYLGKWGGIPLVLRFGRYLLLDKEHLEFTVRWFEKRGEITILICRFIPVVRHLISIPAGIGKMNFARFSLYTLVGGTIWNTILLAAGVWLKERWDIIHQYSREIDYVVAALLLLAMGWWIHRQWKRRR
jgi:membrane protein DedA with SNARE-associated domain